MARWKTAWSSPRSRVTVPWDIPSSSRDRRWASHIDLVIWVSLTLPHFPNTLLAMAWLASGSAFFGE